MRCAMKRITGRKNMTRRWPQGILLLGLTACSSCAWLETKPVLNVGPDGRGCMVGIVDSTDAAILRTKNPAVKAGDVLFTPYCASEIGVDLHNEIYELTR